MGPEFVGITKTTRMFQRVRSHSINHNGGYRPDTKTTSHECKKVRPAVVACLTSAAVLDQDLLHCFDLGGYLSRRVE